MTKPRRCPMVVPLIVLLLAGCSGAIRTSPPAGPAGSAQPPASDPPSTQPAAASLLPDATPTVVLPGESWIAYSWLGPDGGGAVLLSRPDGSGTHALDPGVPGDEGHPDWSPDGRQIVYVRTEHEANEAIWVMNSDGSGAHEIAPAQPGCCGQDHPYWSPDGRSIAFIRWVGPEASATSEVEIYDVPSGSFRVLATSRLPVILDQPRWAPDGRTLAVEVSTTGRDGSCCVAGAIGLIPLATGKVRILTKAVTLAGAPDWSPDGKTIVFDSIGLSYEEDTTPGQATNLYSINVDGSGLAQLTHNAPGGHRATEPFWRADGTIGYVEAEAQRSLNRFVRFISADGRQLADPATPILATHPRIWPRG